MSRENRWICLFILGFALLVRLVLLGIKPAHFDEGVNGWFVDQMRTLGFYRYDPANYHGPLHFYVLFLSQTLFGRNLWALRVPVVLVGVASIYLVLLFDRFIDRRICRIAALALAVSPGMIFYHRYAIHESWMMFFLLLLFWGALGLWQFGSRGYLWAFALGISGMTLIKETYIIHLVAFGLAIGTLALLERISPSAPLAKAPQRWATKDLWTVLGVNLGLLVFFYSGAFLDFKSLPGIYLTFAEWFKTGTAGHGHEKPFYYWLQLMLRYEWPLALGFLASLAILRPGAERPIRLLAIYGVGTLVAYSIVPYKTPWCIISIAWPFAFLFGELAVVAMDRFRREQVVGAVCALLLLASAGAAVRLNFFRYTEESEPYVYVQTFEDINRLTGPLFQLVKQSPAAYHLPGNLVLSSCYPLPWILGDFTGLGYYGEGHLPEAPDADFLVVDKSRVALVEPQLRGSYFTEEIRIRASQEPAMIYWGVERFAPLFPGRAPDLIR